jgi:hypothetical protein
MIIAAEIHGTGFPLACDFLKELGWTQYGKPDAHTKTILKGLGFSDGSDYYIFKVMVLMAKLLHVTPFQVDKILWLIGSGNLYLADGRFRTNRAGFVREARKALIDDYELHQVGSCGVAVHSRGEIRQ